MRSKRRSNRKNIIIVAIELDFNYNLINLIDTLS